MRLAAKLATLLVLLPSASPAAAAGPTTQPIAWQNWSDQAFAQAKREHKFVLLDLHAVWCHWCHVMDEETYSDPKVLALIADKYIPVSVDADARPDLANRYEDYGWPATVVFSADGKEIVKRQGYIPPRRMAAMLQAIIDDPTPGPSVVAPREIAFTNQTSLGEQVRQKVLRNFLDNYDWKVGGWGTIHKYLDWDAVEYCIENSPRDERNSQMAQQTLAGGRNLIDPVWGGVCQYSVDGDWMHPHFEKLIQFQAENLRVYSLAFERWKNPRDLESAQKIRQFMAHFLLSPDGAFYTSQDADLSPEELGEPYYKLSDTQRRALGIPRVDKHIYARENGWAISGLCVFYSATSDASALDQAKTSAQWIVDHRSLPGGGFRHDENDPAGPYLGDSLAIGQAFLSLYEVTADRQYLKRAQAAADFINANFIPSDRPGIATAAIQSSQMFPPDFELDENVSVARFTNLLGYYSGRKSDRDLAARAMRYLASPAVALGRQLGVAGILLADLENTSPPIHIAIVGSKQNAGAANLFAAAGAIPVSYKRVEWFDPAQGPLPNQDVDYPVLPRSAAFLCTGSACSAPSFTPEKLQQTFQRAQDRSN